MCATNVFFNNYRFTGEQQLYEDLIVETIQIHGDDMYYIPRNTVNEDPILGEDDMSSYTKAYLLEIYVRSYDGFEGDGTFVSKFGLEIRDQVTFTISKRRFVDEIGAPHGLLRPREADLIYFPLNRKLFKISYVDNKPFFYPFGELFTYDLYCENFEYSSEIINTGIPEIDAIMAKSQDTYYWAIRDNSNNAILDNNGMPILPSTYSPIDIDPIDDSDEIEEQADDIIDWSVKDPFSEGNY